MTASGREHPKGCESKYSTYSQIPYQQSTRIQLHVPKRTPAGAPPGGAALPFMSPTTRTLSILTGPHPRGRPRSPRQAAVRSSARRPRAGRGPPALARRSVPPPGFDRVALKARRKILPSAPLCCVSCCEKSRRCAEVMGRVGRLFVRPLYCRDQN